MNSNLLLQCSQTYDLSLVCVFIWLARPPFRALLYYTHTDRMQMVSLRIDRNCTCMAFSPARHLMWWNDSKWNNTSDEGHAHPEPPPRCWPLKFTIPSYKSWMRSWYIIAMQIFPCYSLFSFHPYVTCLIYSIILPASRHSTGETIRSERRNKRKSSWRSDLVGKQDLRRLQRIQPSARLPGSGTIRWIERRRN